MANLQGLTSYCGQLNLSGLILIEYAPITYVDLTTYEQSTIYQLYHTKDIPFLSGKGWLTAPVLNQSRIWNEAQRRTAQGIFYEQTVNAIVPGLTPSGNAELERMAHFEYLLRLKDRNGNKWIMGTPETPFRFQANGTSGDGNSRKQHSISWESETLRKAIGFIAS